MKVISGFFKWLVFTNLYIAVAAVCFQWIFAARSGLLSDWNWMLTAHTFFSTWLVYQFSRMHFHRNVPKDQSKVDELYLWFDKHINFTVASVLLSAVATLVTIYFLRWETLGALAILGGISLLYPIDLKAGGKSLRSIPFIKIFLIALVWSGMAVVVPQVESGRALADVLQPLIWYFLFILFITLPFDMVDMPTDKATKVKTIPAVLGWNTSRRLVVIMGLILMFWEGYWTSRSLYFSNPALLIAEILLIAAYIFITFRIRQHTDKWKIMVLYDGSMILLFCLTFILHG